MSLSNYLLVSHWNRMRGFSLYFNNIFSTTWWRLIIWVTVCIALGRIVVDDIDWHIGYLRGSSSQSQVNCVLSVAGIIWHDWSLEEWCHGASPVVSVMMVLTEKTNHKPYFSINTWMINLHHAIIIWHPGFRPFK